MYLDKSLSFVRVGKNHSMTKEFNDIYRSFDVLPIFTIFSRLITQKRESEGEVDS